MDADPALSDSEQSDVLAVLSRTSATPVFGLAPFVLRPSSLVSRGELREESGLGWLDWIGCKSVQSLGWCPGCFSLRRPGDLARQGLCPPILGFGALRVVTCQLPDVPPPGELERDARGLTFDVLSGCVGLTKLVEGIPALQLHECDSISDA